MIFQCLTFCEWQGNVTSNLILVSQNLLILKNVSKVLKVKWFDLNFEHKIKKGSLNLEHRIILFGKDSKSTLENSNFSKKTIPIIVIKIWSAL